MARGLAARLLAVASLGRGAVLWIPAMLVAGYLVLFGIRQAPRGFSLFTRTTGTRVVVGPWRGDAGAGAAPGALVAALRVALAHHGELALVDSTRVADRLRAVPDATAGAAGFLHAIRPLNPHLGLCGTLESTPAGLRARLEAWDPHAGSRILDVAVDGSDPALLGRALADSLRAALFVPHAFAGLR